MLKRESKSIAYPIKKRFQEKFRKQTIQRDWTTTLREFTFCDFLLMIKFSMDNGIFYELV